MILVDQAEINPKLQGAIHHGIAIRRGLWWRGSLHQGNPSPPRRRRKRILDETVSTMKTPSRQ